MKTLDEVIDAMERCSKPHYFDCTGCPYEDAEDETGCHPDDRDADVLHYLKECKAYRDRLTSDKAQTIICPRCHSEMGIFLPEGNEPLTWDELKQMEGKPVWLESHGDITEFTGWAIVRNALEDRAHFIFSHYDGEFLTYEMALPDVTFGKEWNVYRKERHER